MENKLPVIVQTIIFRKQNNTKLQFLLLKRTEGRGGFWNVVNGTLRTDETVEECGKRELKEEAGISEYQNRSQEIYRFHFNHGDSPVTVVVHYAQISPEQEIVINEEHNEYKWVNVEEALGMLKFDDDKKALEICYKKVNK